MAAIIAALALAGTIAAASAEQSTTFEPDKPVASDPLIIWNDLRVGMTKDQVRALYPERRTQLADGCFADISGEYERGQLSRVNLEWSTRDKSKRCGVIIATALAGKYGEPQQTERELKSNNCGNRYAGGLAGVLANLCDATVGNEPDTLSYAKWTSAGVEIVLKRDSGDESKWWLVYRPAVQVDPATAAKL